MLLLLLSRESRVWLCATPETAAYQAPPSLGVSRHEHWSGLPFPPPMHESEKWKWSRSVMSDSSWPHGLQPTRFLRPWDFLGKSTGVGCHSLLWCNGSDASKSVIQLDIHAKPFQVWGICCTWRCRVTEQLRMCSLQSGFWEWNMVSGIF